MAAAVELIVISGRSGSGKTVALRALEDLGFYCIDNLPVQFLAELISSARTLYPRLAVSLDIRNLPRSSGLQRLADTYKRVVNDPEIHTSIIYLDAEDQVLIHRYAFTRRLHPLSQQQRTPLDEAVSQESRLLSTISAVADLRIDTTRLSIHELNAEIATLVNGRPGRELLVIFESFGFKDGIAADADFVFDCRFLPNPYWEQELRACSGLDAPVRGFFQKYPEVQRYIDEIDTLLTRWLGQISSANRSYLTVALGCTGGRHRSVYVAQSLCDRFKSRDVKAQVRHRSLMKAAAV